MRRVLADALVRQGFEVVGLAGDGDEALDLCRRERPDALTLDLHMPGLDGLGVLRALRDNRADAVPVVVVSAFSPAHGARAVDALAEGAFDLVAKPAVGDSLDGFSTELARKVAEAARAGRTRRVARRAAAPAATAPPPAGPATPRTQTPGPTPPAPAPAPTSPRPPPPPPRAPPPPLGLAAPPRRPPPLRPPL